MTACRPGWIGRAAGYSLGAILPIVLSAPAAAEVAEDVRRDVAALVEDLTGVSGLSSFVFDQIDIAEDGGGYRVTLAGVELQPNTDASVQIGDVVLALEAEADGYRIAGAELPETMQLLSPDGGPAGQLHVARFGLTGFWQRSTSVLTEVDLTLGDVAVDLPGDALLDGAAATSSHVMVGAATLQGRLAPAADGKWREEVHGSLSGLRLEQGGAADTLSIVAIESVTEGIDLERQRELQQLMVAAMQGGAGPDPATLAAMRALSDTVRATRFKISAEGLELGQLDAQPIRVPRIALSQSAEGLDGALARADFQLTIEQAEMSSVGQVAGVPDSMGPQTVELDIAIDALPWPAVWEAFVDFLYAPAMDEEGGWRLALALQDAGTRLQLEPSRLSSDPLTVTGDGEVKADPAAAFGAVASFGFEIVGLAAAQSLAMEAPDGGLALGFLGQLDAMGAPSAGPDDAPVHRYDIVLGADGALTINGEPLMLGEPGIEN